MRNTQKYFKLIRLVIQSFILKKITLMKFSGHLEIDEAHIYKKKDIRGRPFALHYWVFGIKCRRTKTCLIIPVQDRTHRTLISIILGKYSYNKWFYFF